jgi:hypothetical protein
MGSGRSGPGFDDGSSCSLTAKRPSVTLPCRRMVFSGVSPGASGYSVSTWAPGGSATLVQPGMRAWSSTT